MQILFLLQDWTAGHPGDSLPSGHHGCSRDWDGRKSAKPSLYLFYFFSYPVQLWVKSHFLQVLKFNSLCEFKMTKPMFLVAKIFLWENTLSPAVNLTDIFKTPQGTSTGSWTYSYRKETDMIWFVFYVLNCLDFYLKQSCTNATKVQLVGGISQNIRILSMFKF